MIPSMRAIKSIREIFNEFSVHVIRNPIVKSECDIVVTPCLVIRLSGWEGYCESIEVYIGHNDRQYIHIDKDKFKMYKQGELTYDDIFENFDLENTKYYMKEYSMSVKNNTVLNEINEKLVKLKKMVVSIDKNKIEENLEFKEELISYVMKPERLNRFAGACGMEFVDYVETI
jgi:hypothetical protein